MPSLSLDHPCCSLLGNAHMTLAVSPQDRTLSSNRSCSVPCDGVVARTGKPARLWVAGLIPYETAWVFQQRLVEQRLCNTVPDTVLLMEHEPAFTLGRRSLKAHWGGNDETTTWAGCPIYRIERGGSITYHGPGQVVGYPIVNLRAHCPGPKPYMQKLESVLIRTLALWGISGVRRAGCPGVWVDHGSVKIAAMGTHIRRGVTMHGFALNVTVDLRPFETIIPCGLEDGRVTSMAEILGSAPDIQDVKHHLAESFALEFGLEWTDRRRMEMDDILAQETSHG